MLTVCHGILWISVYGQLRVLLCREILWILDLKLLLWYPVDLGS